MKFSPAKRQSAKRSTLWFADALECRRLFSVPTVWTSDIAVPRAKAGQDASASVVVHLSSAATKTVRVSYTTKNGTARAGSDYTAARGTLVIKAGRDHGRINIDVPGSSVVAPTKKFYVDLLGSQHAALNATGVFSRVTILNGNKSASLPRLSIGDATVIQSSTASKTLAFTVSLSSAPRTAVSVFYTTINGTAVAGTEYTAASGILSFAPGQTTRTLLVTALPGTDALDTSFAVRLSSPTNATIGGNTGIGTISAATPAIISTSLIASDAQITKGAAGTRAIMQFNVALTQATNAPVTVHFATADGTAVAGKDYIATTGTLFFAPGTILNTIKVIIPGGAQLTTDLTFTLNLSQPVNASILTATGTGTILSGASNQTDLSDNLGEATTGSPSVSGTDWIAGAFQTGPASVTLDSVILQLADTIPGNAQVLIFTSDITNQVPGQPVGALISPSGYSSTPAPTVFLGTGQTLNANTRYWVVLSAPTGGFTWSSSTSTNGIGRGFIPLSATSMDGGATWTSSVTTVQQFSVLVT